MLKKIWKLIALLCVLLILWKTIPMIKKPFPKKIDESGANKEDTLKVVNANNQFAIDLYLKLSEEEDRNLFYSPYSIFSALAMTYEGAKTQTAEEIKSVFHFPNKEILRPNYASIYNRVNSEKKGYELKTGNALWIAKDYPISESYVNTIEKSYGGRVTNLDFENEAEESRHTINEYIEDQTNNKIKDLIPENILDKQTKLVLTNAIYFKGTWLNEFKKSNTVKQNFAINPDNIISTPMMKMFPNDTEFKYLNTGDLEILELPYKGEAISMLILLPTENLESLQNSLTSEMLENYKLQMRKTELGRIEIPKFKTETKYFMRKVLEELGMPLAFSNQADFSEMTKEGSPLKISDVIHQAFVEVNEEGTEAAAATAVTMMMSAAPSEPEINFIADHPFIFIIQENETGSILFMGRIINPKQ